MKTALLVLALLTASFAIFHNQIFNSYYENVVSNCPGIDDNLTLTYFNLRGRGEPIRLLLHYHDIDFTDKRLSYDEFLQEKEKRIYTDFKFGQLPHLQNGKSSVVQMMAILDHLERSIHNCPIENEESRSLKYQYALALEDIRKKYGAIAYSSAPDRESLLENFIEKTLPTQLDFFERILVNNGGFYGKGDFLVGDSLSYVDILLYDLLTTFHHSSVDPNCLKNFPMLKSFKSNLDNNKNIKEYSESDQPKQYHGRSAWLGGKHDD
eukprot:TRINITY_DN16018_c0_g1_i1.p1 TRINITY_DN16018_c0_g1~~TRINITY_DN16018_c0_g1_i1.p1  ORF type:complete len:266 (-),score=85.19 TRINITY_DN16018_c0_g1_i1:134-931(-)